MSSRNDLGFLLAKASQRWNELLAERFRSAGYREVRPAYGSVLVPLFEQDGLRMGELARRSRLSKQTMTTLVRLAERDGLVERRPDLADARATLVLLTARAQEFRAVADRVLDELASRVSGALGVEQAAELKRLLRGVMEL
jgi:MarR family transcriptional regulator, organic hydroperoxide resistance regulator